MPRVKKIAPPQSRNKGERNLDIPLYLNRYLPPYARPGWVDGRTWRQVVDNIPVAVDCREDIIEYVLSLDWMIEPKESDQRDELKSEIDYYTKLFTDTGEYDYTTLVEWVLADYLDLPFGGAVEVGRQGDDPKGKVLWLEPLDGATLYPYPNKDWPIAQYVPEASIDTVYFPTHAINRIYMSPRRDIRRQGWGIAPPEKIYLALELLNRGSRYYASLLIDTPEVGILDLMDMDAESAKEWLEAWRNLLGGVDPYKIPVLYEHEKKAEFISFSRSPTEIMFDKANTMQAALVAAGYGVSLSDIGYPTTAGGGETLAGSIRFERKTRRKGYARARKKAQLWWNRMLPDYLNFRYIDLDDELSVSITRARLGGATAAGSYIDKGVFTEEEMRQQAIADGLITISVPEKLPQELLDKKDQQNNNGNMTERPSMLGRPVTPGSGGWGEVAARSRLENDLLGMYKSINDIEIKRMIGTAFTGWETYRGLVENLGETDNWGLDADDGGELPQGSTKVLSVIISEIKRMVQPLDFDLELCENDIVSIMKSSWEDVLFEELNNMYIRGEIDKSQYERRDLPGLDIELLGNDIRELTNEVNRMYCDIAPNAVACGVIEYAGKYQDASLEGALSSQSLLDTIRSTIRDDSVNVMKYIARKISDIIYGVINNA